VGDCLRIAVSIRRISGDRDAAGFDRLGHCMLRKARAATEKSVLAVRRHVGAAD